MNHTSLNISYLAGLKKVKQREISEATGVSQSKISRIVNGAEADYDEVVALSRYFKVPKELLISTDLTSQFATLAEYDAWVVKNTAAKVHLDEHLAAVNLAPIALQAIVEHYVRTMAPLTGKTPEELHEEIDSIYQLLLEEHQKPLANTSYLDAS